MVLTVALPLVVNIPGAFRSAWACLSERQFPARTPMDLAPFTRWMPAASSGASKAVVGCLHRQLADRRHPLDDA